MIRGCMWQIYERLITCSRVPPGPFSLGTKYTLFGDDADFVHDIMFRPFSFTRLFGMLIIVQSLIPVVRLILLLNSYLTTSTPAPPLNLPVRVCGLVTRVWLI